MPVCTKGIRGFRCYRKICQSYGKTNGTKQFHNYWHSQSNWSKSWWCTAESRIPRVSINIWRYHITLLGFNRKEASNIAASKSIDMNWVDKGKPWEFIMIYSRIRYSRSRQLHFRYISAAYLSRCSLGTLSHNGNYTPEVEVVLYHEKEEVDLVGNRLH